ncbi:hypothetical protein L0F63_004668 [Massospora cicadina]|nr:hypothetical protein L0F63_004668 [Massospora cicadina]
MSSNPKPSEFTRLEKGTPDYETARVGFEIQDTRLQLSQLEVAISEEAAENPERILGQLSGFLTADETFGSIKEGLTSLESCFERLSARVRHPRTTLATEVHRLERLHQLSALLRDLVRLSQLVRQLTLINLEDERAATLIQRIELGLKGGRFVQLKSAAALIDYTAQRKLRAFNRAKEYVADGLGLKNPLLLARGISSLDHLGLVSKALTDLGPAQSNRLKRFIRSQCQATPPPGAAHRLALGGGRASFESCADSGKLTDARVPFFCLISTRRVHENLLGRLAGPAKLIQPALWMVRPVGLTRAAHLVSEP